MHLTNGLYGNDVQTIGNMSDDTAVSVNFTIDGFLLTLWTLRHVRYGNRENFAEKFFGQLSVQQIFYAHLFNGALSRLYQSNSPKNCKNSV